MLEEFFSDTAEPLDLAIRTIIGMDPEAVQERFTAFAQQASEADRQADALLALLQNHIARYGSITVDRLYDAPFTVVDADGLDGVFEDEDEVNDLLQHRADLRPADRGALRRQTRTKGRINNGHG